jgi:flagellar protein FliL
MANAATTKQAKNGDKEKEKEEEAPKKNKSKFLLIVIIAGVLILGSGGYFAWKFLLAAPDKATVVKKRIGNQMNSSARQEADETKSTLGPVQPLETFIVNLSSADGQRYLKATVSVELSDEAAVKEAAARAAQLRDAIIVLLSSKTVDEVTKLEGKEMLKREIVARINGFLVEGKARRVYFTEFVVQ